MLSVIRTLFVLTLVLYTVNYIGGWLPTIAILICEHLLMAVTLLLMILNGISENKRHKDRKLQRVIDGCIAYCVCSILALLLFYYGNITNYSYVYSIGVMIFCGIFDQCRLHRTI